MKTVLRIRAILVVVLLAGTLSAQAVDPAFKTFDKDGLKFNYPADWTLTDRSSADAQNLMLSKEGALVLIMVVSPRVNLTSYEQFAPLQVSVNDRYVKAIKKGLAAPDDAAKVEYRCLDLNGRRITGTRFNGAYQKQPSVGDVYPFIVGDRFLTLLYMRADKDADAGDPVWQGILKTLNDGNTAVAPKLDSSSVAAGVLNGTAIKLFQPQFPSGNPGGYSMGLVKVHVVIDEKGNVISAKAISGAPALLSISEQAAKLSKFKPTVICDRPVQIEGTILYNFDPFSDPYKPPRN